MENPKSIENQEKNPNQELLNRAEILFSKSIEDSEGQNNIISHLVGNSGMILQRAVVEVAIEEHDEHFLGLIKERVDMLERYFAIKEQHPEIIQEIKDGKYDEDPEFKDLTSRTEKSQSELVLEAIENIVNRSE
jgi:hypothetical protein